MSYLHLLIIILDVYVIMKYYSNKNKYFKYFNSGHGIHLHLKTFKAVLNRHLNILILFFF